MSSFRVFKYASPLLIYVGALRAFTGTGLVVWLPVLYSFVVVPLLELLLRPDPRNLSAAGEELARRNPVYDWLLYAIVPMQWGALALFLQGISTEPLSGADLAGRTAVMGLLCGTFGINVGHELGHRVKKSERALALTLLLSSLYMHFYIEHNKGHHKRVATPEDPSSARYGEALYPFWWRSIAGSLKSAWHIAGAEARKEGAGTFSWRNAVLVFVLVQAALLVLVGAAFGAAALGAFLVAALLGILLLETVNYIEHYGLQRKATAGGYERALPAHSWNSSHVIGRVMLFELSRHSDHHYLASRKYQVLRHHDDAPQMPTGYPGMMLLALVPPVWFYVMNKRARAATGPAEAATALAIQ
ncbi:alkane 1-monooxygenase [Flaviaesturariibacter amylovorans]|uniref:Alkane 1-monooxygenase n=1 Tax=Flaviaesturariibacter amylovorans TaxID=1084520 RepID=A0ABP8G9W6_9BACT